MSLSPDCIEPNGTHACSDPDCSCRCHLSDDDYAELKYEHDMATDLDED